MARWRCSARKGERPGRTVGRPGSRPVGSIGAVAFGHPAAASYLRTGSDEVVRPMGVDVLRIEDGVVADVTAFLRPDLFEAFGLPPSLR